MKKIFIKAAEYYAKSTTSTCSVWFFHAPKAPKSLIK